MRLLVTFLALAVALVAAQSPECRADLQGTLNDIMTVGEDIVGAQSTCSTGNTTACQAAIKAIVGVFGNITVDLTGVAKDCFGASGNTTLCAQMVTRVISDTGVVSADVVQAVKDCNPSA